MLKLRSTFITGIASQLILILSPAVLAAPECKAVLEESVKSNLESRLKEAKTFTAKLPDGRSNFVQFVAPADPNQPTLLLLPGMNRSLLVSDKGVQNLAAQGFGVVSMSFSSQPFSIAQLEKAEVPAFRKNRPSLEDFAQEVEFVAAQVKQLFAVKEIIPVSLSYSGAVSAKLKGFPLVIETVPMTSDAAANTKGAQYRQMMNSGAAFNPFFGKQIARNLVDNAYRQHWQKQADALIATYNLPKERRDDLIEGYVALSRAAEDSNWDNMDFSEKTRRVFVLAENEGPELLKSQLQTFKEMLKQRKDALMFIVGESGHVLPSDQPKAYAQILDWVTRKSMDTKSGVIFLNPSTQKVTTIPREDAEKYLDQILKSLK